MPSEFSEGNNSTTMKNVESTSDSGPGKGIKINPKLRSEWISDLYSWCTANPGEMDYFDEIFHRKVEFPGLGGSWLMESNDLNVGEYRALVYDTWFKKNYDPVVVVSVRVVEELIERAKTLKENT